MSTSPCRFLIEISCLQFKTKVLFDKLAWAPVTTVCMLMPWALRSWRGWWLINPRLVMKVLWWKRGVEKFVLLVHVTGNWIPRWCILRNYQRCIYTYDVFFFRWKLVFSWTGYADSSWIQQQSRNILDVKINMPDAFRCLESGINWPFPLYFSAFCHWLYINILRVNYLSQYARPFSPPGHILPWQCK